MSSIAIELDQVVKEYPGRLALKGISFQVKKGRIHGFLGPNGAGKSTTMKIITGLLRANSGNVSIIEGERIGFLPENPPLYMNMKVEGYLQYVKNLYSLDKDHGGDSLEVIMKKCGLLEVKERLIRNLSKGYKQRVGIASTLVHNPEIIILDEPTVGLDPKAILEIRDLIKELSRNHTILLSTHQLYEANLLCEDITIINKGEILTTGEVSQIREKISGGQRLYVEVEGARSEILEKMVQELPIELRDQVLGDISSFKVFSKETHDIRSRLSSFLAKEGCIVLSLKEETLDLEGIFKEVTFGVQDAQRN